MKTRRAVVASVAIVALVAILAVCLVACNAESYQKKLEKKDYEVVILQGDDVPEGIEWIVNGTKMESLISVKNVTVTKYSKSADCKEAYQSAVDNFGKDHVYRTGSILIVGSDAQAVKDAK